MTYAPFASDQITLRNPRISADDGARQERTAIEILRRFAHQPGIVLADEVGMGKTYVALSVAASVVLDQPDGAPVVIMVPPSLRDKWPKEWNVFAELCLGTESSQRIRSASADSGVAFLKLLDDPPERKTHIVFLTHGALHRALTDGYAKLAVIKRAFKNRSSLAEQRRNFGKFAGRLLRLEATVERRAPGLLGDLLERPYDSWLRAIQRAHPELKKDFTDDPVPRHLQDVLESLDSKTLEPLVDQLHLLPIKESTRIEERLREARRALGVVMEEIWKLALRKVHFQSPLLILDEAHHLKNPATQLASLFVDEEAAKDSEFFDTSGALGGKFQRMLFLTATPFQLGHAELLRVVERFEGICWNGNRPPALSRADFRDQTKQLGEALDDAQAAALRLDRGWGRLTEDDLRHPDGASLAVDEWWEQVSQSESASEDRIGQLVQQVATTRSAIHVAEDRLRPWVIRHLKPTRIAGMSSIERRQVFPGRAIVDDRADGQGIEIDGPVLLPFLLAGRAQALLAAAKGRAFFAEGLASSFEAYLETRRGAAGIDEDGTGTAIDGAPPELQWYLQHLDCAFTDTPDGLRQFHPKVRATAQRVVQLWKAGEKVLVFCHYRATGRALRRHVSALLREEILCLGRQKLPALQASEIASELDRIGDRFFDTDGPLRTEVTRALGLIVSQCSLPPEDAQQVVEVILRFLRTPSFLVRYVDLGRDDQVGAFVEAIERDDVGGLSLRRRIENFCLFLAGCVPDERQAFLKATDSIQTGSHVERDVQPAYDPTERVDEGERAHLLPNVRLANGEVAAITRQKLLLAFNTPLFPEILIASSVLAEGVDLHHECRYVIHHDLCWNPSTLEQRTGRVDRIGSKAERVVVPIHIYLPYVAATQDEKMFRVVRDRERWFQIVMGERYEVDEAATDRRAARVPLPGVIATQLTMRLQV